MNRRKFIAAGAASTAALTLTAGVAQAAPLMPLTSHGGRARWSAQARAHEHALIAMRWIDKVMNERAVYGQEIWPIDLKVTLRDPRFIVEVDKAWDHHDGYRAGRTGPRVQVFDGDVKVIEGELFFYHGSDPIPPVSMISRHFGGGDVNHLRQLLPGQVSYDNSRFFAALDAMKTQPAHV
jgi:hypothetical protein